MSPREPGSLERISTISPTFTEPMLCLASSSGPGQALPRASATASAVTSSSSSISMSYSFRGASLARPAMTRANPQNRIDLLAGRRLDRRVLQSVEQLSRKKRTPGGLVLLDERLPDHSATLDELGVRDRVVDGLAVLAWPHEHALFEDPQVLRDVVDRQPQSDGQITDAHLAGAQGIQDGQTVLVGQRLAELCMHAEQRPELLGDRSRRFIIHLHECMYMMMSYQGQAGGGNGEAHARSRRHHPQRAPRTAADAHSAGLRRRQPGSR